MFDEVITSKCKILDCAAGTGIYAFWLADKGHDVTATDITPRHINIINQNLATTNHSMKTAILDATDMSLFENEEFDVVLNMGPFYHLITEELREKCLSECLRVLKKGGLLVTAYIPRYYIFQYVAMSDEKCFWTDTYYSSKKEMETVYCNHNLKIVDHFSQDGLAPLLSHKVDSWNEQQFKIWCDYHYSVCREESVLGSSNHVIIIGKKIQ